MTFVGVAGKKTYYANSDSPRHVCQDRLCGRLEVERWMSGCFQKHNKCSELPASVDTQGCAECLAAQTDDSRLSLRQIVAVVKQQGCYDISFQWENCYTALLKT